MSVLSPPRKFLTIYPRIHTLLLLLLLTLTHSHICRCGSDHTAAVTQSGNVYTFGMARGGRLGLPECRSQMSTGNLEIWSNCFTPCQVDTSVDVPIEPRGTPLPLHALPATSAAAAEQHVEDVDESAAAAHRHVNTKDWHDDTSLDLMLLHLAPLLPTIPYLPPLAPTIANSADATANSPSALSTPTVAPVLEPPEPFAQPTHHDHDRDHVHVHEHEHDHVTPRNHPDHIMYNSNIVYNRKGSAHEVSTQCTAHTRFAAEKRGVVVGRCRVLPSEDRCLALAMCRHDLLGAQSSLQVLPGQPRVGADSAPPDESMDLSFCYKCWRSTESTACFVFAVVLHARMHCLFLLVCCYRVAKTHINR